ncbi:MAG: zf-HC2 domain-containing protein [Bacteroidetes bacterium]|nr:zf-HC2 domain-containing protein [Bacteroidota bacterium]
MSCTRLQQILGAYLDAELSADEVRQVDSHLRECTECRCEFQSLQRLTNGIASEQAEVPSELWEGVEHRLSATPQGHQDIGMRSHWTQKLRLAAMIAVAVGIIGYFAFVRQGEDTAQASSIDFSVILDTIHLDPDEAFSRFLRQYVGEAIAPTRAAEYAADLVFDVPPMLPGGFERIDVYGLRFGSQPGIAARYRRSDQTLIAIFHPTVHAEDFGTHQDLPCIVGRHHGHAVEVGEWRLVHVTDPVTCHCVLSKLDDDDLAPILETVAPISSGSKNPH